MTGCPTWCPACRAVTQSPGSVTVQVMRLTAYLRVSSASQVEAWGLDRQEAAIRVWAKANGHRIVDWQRDEGLSGTREAVDRPGLSAAIESIGHSTDGILIADLDRFARKLTVQEAALAIIWRAGGRVFTAVSGEVHAEDPDDPSRNLIRQMHGAVIEYEKNMAVKRMRDGMKAKRATGRKATGSYAYGYRQTGKGRKKDAGPDVVEQAAVALILDLRRDGKSYREICDALAAAGHRPKRGGTWQPMVVKRIFDREFMGRAAR